MRSVYLTTDKILSTIETNLDLAICYVIIQHWILARNLCNENVVPKIVIEMGVTRICKISDSSVQVWEKSKIKNK